MVMAFSGIVLRRRRMERQDRLPSRLTQRDELAPCHSITSICGFISINRAKMLPSNATGNDAG
jgi:hypothetical protein